MRVKLTFLSSGQRAVLPLNYNYFLTGLIYRFIRNSSEDYSRFLHDEGYKIGDSKKGFKLFTFSMLKGEKFTVSGGKINFENGLVYWSVSSPVVAFLQHLVTGVFSERRKISIGTGKDRAEFIIERVETLQEPEFKETMRFTCSSPVTVSKVISSVRSESTAPAASSPWSGRNCHYIRPWEEGFQDAIKNNLIKKYRLIHGQDIKDSKFRIAIDPEYMNRKNGKITKNINFKGTNIIGFMAPFEVTSIPELLKVGYEAGFGEKGSMGFGMVKETG